MDAALPVREITRQNVKIDSRFVRKRNLFISEGGESLEVLVIFFSFRSFRLKMVAAEKAKDGSFNLSGWAILAAHVLQVVLLCDFLFRAKLSSSVKL